MRADCFKDLFRAVSVASLKVQPFDTSLPPEVVGVPFFSFQLQLRLPNQCLKIRIHVLVPPVQFLKLLVHYLFKELNVLGSSKKVKGSIPEACFAFVAETFADCEVQGRRIYSPIESLRSLTHFYDKHCALSEPVARMHVSRRNSLAEKANSSTCRSLGVVQPTENCSGELESMSKTYPCFATSGQMLCWRYPKHSHPTPSYRMCSNHWRC
mmetsp:Transcript_4118/g.9964  ORF Transcript_4118/g.9964 Transcript_4118/m.9964 type:complete len:211 (-) Transcript_4118:568-1200(-)